MQKPRIANVLANRYASPEMVELWSAEHKIIMERELWIAVLRAQTDLGVGDPQIAEEALVAYESVKNKVDLASIARREAVTRHDVKARIEEFCALAGFEQIHKGMTSRDLTENVEQLQIKRSLELLRGRAIAVVTRLAHMAATYSDLVMTGRSHNVAAQATTLGKRFASAADEMLVAIDRVDHLIERSPCAALKAPWEPVKTCLTSSMVMKLNSATWREVLPNTWDFPLSWIPSARSTHVLWTMTSLPPSFNWVPRPPALPPLSALWLARNLSQKASSRARWDPQPCHTR